MNVIHIEEKAFFELIERAVEQLGQKHNAPVNRWIDGEEAMRILRIKSLTTLQKLRDEGKITFSQPSKKIILYDRESIDEYIEHHIQPKF